MPTLLSPLVRANLNHWTTHDEKELKAMKSLRLNTGIRILEAGKGNCTGELDESKYNYKLNHLLESAVNEVLSKDPTATIERKCRYSFPSTKLFFLLHTTADFHICMAFPKFTNLTFL
jgi:hypothetical protein